MTVLRMPPGDDTWARELVATLNAEIGRKEPLIVGWRHDGSDWQLRFRAPISSLRVQVHVQGTGVGEGGIAAYDPANSVSSTEVDCREDRLQDVTITGSSRRLVFLIPVNYDGEGNAILFDGEGGREDFMSFADLGA